MVGSSMSDAERRAWNRVIGVGFVIVVGGSAALIAFANGAALSWALAIGVLGLLTGLGLVWYLSTLSMGTGARRRER